MALLDDLDGVTVLATSDEEAGSTTSRELIEAEAGMTAAALVLEAGDGGAVKTARKGISAYDVHVGGRAAHAVASSGTTRNTVPDAATVLVDVRVASAEEQRRVDAAMHGLTPLLPGVSIAVTGGARRPPMAPAASGAHADSEHVVVSELPRRTTLLAALVHELVVNSSGISQPE